jgi:hypothetical protein
MYAAAVFGNRAIAFFNILLIAYLLDQESFGVYTLLSSNALLVQLVLGSWASASVSKYMPTADAADRFGRSAAASGGRDDGRVGLQRLAHFRCTADSSRFGRRLVAHPHLL